jgi:hypothetical protein
VTPDDDLGATVGDPVEDLGEVAAQVFDRDAVGIAEVALIDATAEVPGPGHAMPLLVLYRGVVVCKTHAN